MDTPAKPLIIALEEHFSDSEVNERYGGKGEKGPAALRERLADLGALRLKEMDEAGIDIQVLSHGASAIQKMDAETAVPLVRRVNDRLHAAVLAHPDRFAGFAELPLVDPKAAAAELERTVTKLGFKGAMVQAQTNGVFFDDKRFWPICERAQALDVPLYLHPAPPHPAVVDAYYKDYLKDFPRLVSAGWGYTVETATLGVRMVLSGVFDAYPRLKVILGHLGESLPFSLWRIDRTVGRGASRSLAFRDTFREHFWITTSGNFSTQALMCSIMEMGTDRILFSVDWPYENNAAGTKWMRELPLSSEDTEKILSGNAKRLLRM